MINLHENFKICAVLCDEGIAAATTDYICVRDANWITAFIIEDNLSGAGTSHNWSVYAADTQAGTNGAVMTTGVRVWSETDIVAGTLLDTFAETTVTTGLFASDTTTTTWQIHVVSVDPMALGTNATSSTQNDYIAFTSSAASANTNSYIIVLLDQKYKEALGGPTIVS